MNVVVDDVHAEAERWPDRRVINLYLTDRGRDLMAGLPPVGRMTDEEILRGLSREEIDCFVGTLRAIIAGQARDEDRTPV